MALALGDMALAAEVRTWEREKGEGEKEEREGRDERVSEICRNEVKSEGKGLAEVVRTRERRETGEEQGGMKEEKEGKSRGE